MTDRATVLRLITRLNVGGPARQALLLTKSLGGEFPTVLAAGRPTADEGELADPAVDVARVSLVRPLSPLADARAIRDVRHLLTGTRASLLHTHMAKAGTVGRVAAGTVRPRPARVHTFHGHVLDGYFRPTVERAFIAVERALARRTDVLIAVSTEIRDQLLALDIGRPDQYRVVPLGLDLTRHAAVAGPTGWLRSRLGVGPDVPLAASVGRLVPIKDHGTLLKAWTRVPDAHLAIVGDGERRAELEELTRALGLADRVHFTGWVFDVPAVMADIDVAVLTSRNEGTPVALIEAAACGRPAVATAVGGVPSVVRDGETGLLVPPGDPTAFAAAVTVLLADDDRRRRMGDAARAVADGFTADRLVADIRALYAELL